MIHMTVNQMFLNNKYTRWYHNIIDNAFKEKRTKSRDQYYELHHVIPKSLKGTDENDNLVYLTAKEHFICHALLVKMVSDHTHRFKMLCAFHNLQLDRHGKRYTSRLYDYFKPQWAKAISENKKGTLPWNAGKKHPEETLKKMRKPRKNWSYVPTEEHKKKNSESLKGRIHSRESIQKRVAKLKGRKQSQEHIEKNRIANSGEKNPMYGRKHSEEARKKMSETRRRKYQEKVQKLEELLS